MSLLPASIKGIGSKEMEKRWRNHFPIISQWGIAVAMDNRGFIQSAAKHYILQPFSIPSDDKFDQDWSIGPRDIQVRKCHSRTSDSKVSSLIRPEIKLVRAFMRATVMMIRSKMNALAWRHHFPIISLWETFGGSRADNSVLSGLI